MTDGTLWRADPPRGTTRHSGEVEITEPVPRPLQALLRRAVLDHVTVETRRCFPPVLHVGVPGLVTRSYEEEPREPHDLSLRVDIVSALVRRTRRPGPPPLVWLVRPGPVTDQPHDADLAWLAATRAAGGELGLALPMVVVGRHGWRDPRTGVGRTWVRLRESRPRTG